MSLYWLVLVHVYMIEGSCEGVQHESCQGYWLRYTVVVVCGAFTGLLLESATSA